MKKLKQYLPFLILAAILATAFLLGQQKSKKEASSVFCKFSEITTETVKNLPGGGEFDEKMIRQMNNETPYCKDLCLEELENSKKYSEWYTTNEVRDVCKEVGVVLPK